MALPSKQNALNDDKKPRTPRDLPAPARPNALIERLQTWRHSIWRRRWLSMVTAWCLCIAGWMVVALWPTSFVASAVVHADLAELMKQSPTDDKSDQTPSTILRSLLLSDEAVDNIRSEVSLAPSKAQSLRDDLALRSTVPPVFVLTYEHEDPDTAQQVLESVISSFRSKLSVASTTSIDGQDELQAQIDDYQENLQSVEADLAAFKRNNADYLNDDNGDEAELTLLKEEVLGLERQIEEAIAERDAIATELAEARNPNASSTDTASSNLSEEIETERKTLEEELAKLQERYADSHPYVIAVLDTIRALDVEAEAVSSSPEIGSVDDGTPADRDALEQQHGELITAVSTLNSNLANKRGEIELLEALTTTSTSVESELAELESGKEELTVALLDLQKRRDGLGEAKTGEATQESFRLIKQPELPTDPVGPSRLVALAAVLIGGSGAGAAVALFCNRLKGVFESAWQLRKRFDVGVLGTISEVMTPTERKKLGHSRLAFGLAALALIGVFSGLTFAELTDQLAPLGDQLRLQLLG